KMPFPKKSDIPFFALAGFVGITLYHLCLNIGEQTVTAGTSSFLVSAVPIFTALFSLFILKQKLNKWGWFGILISFSGIALISFSESGFGTLNTGTLLVLMAACSGSLYVIFQKRLLEKYTPLEVASYTFWFGTFFMLIFIPQLIHDIQIATTIATLEVVYLGIFPAAVAYVIWTYVLPKFPSATHITSYLYISPVLTMIIALIWIHEIPTIASIIGGFITLGGVILTNTMGR
ncbi:MAG: EamA family transporter, partial [Bacteroidetes bacterium]|nr:EamA family transporter [Bacteroidota bacterium]MBT7825604.1 EamA family transporter [Bacteroidota bacterium]